MSEEGKDYWNIEDHLSSANLIANNRGEVMEKLDYYPYGTERIDEVMGGGGSDGGGDGSASPSSLVRHTFTDQERDSESGLMYYGARYYHPEAGRFTSVDPASLYSPQSLLADPQSQNAYSYARNNPLVYTDPSGEFAETFWDIANTVLDFGSIAINLGQMAGDTLLYGAGKLANNSNLTNFAQSHFKENKSDIKSAIVDAAVDLTATAIPFAPAGLTKLDDVALGVGRVRKASDNIVKQTEDVFSRTANHAQKHYPDLSKSQIEDLARQTKENADIKIKIKGETPKIYYYNSKTNDLFINNPKQPTIFQPSNYIDYLRAAVNKDIKRGGFLK